MPIESVTELVEEFDRIKLLRPEQQAELASHAGHFRDYRELAKFLVIDRAWATRYQVVQVIRGTGRDLLFAGYILQDLVGQGGMGQVFRAEQRTTGRIVALKVVRPERLAGVSSIRRFRREVKALARLAHPNVVLAFDADEFAGSQYLVMEYVEGFDLARWVKTEGPLPIMQAVECIRQGALGLQHAHDQGLIHRDVKPSNLLYAPATGNVKLLDLGLAFFAPHATVDTSLTALTQEGAIIGTVDFIAPEQATDSRAVDSRSDLYSLGCTFYYLLTGQVPFPDMDTLEKLIRHKLDDPMPVEMIRLDVPIELAMIVRRLMAKNPQDRYQTSAELANVLASWLLASKSGELRAYTPPLPKLELGDLHASNQSSSGPRDFAQLMDQVTDDRQMPGPVLGGSVIRTRDVLVAAIASIVLIILSVVGLVLLFPRPPR